MVERLTNFYYLYSEKVNLRIHQILRGLRLYGTGYASFKMLRIYYISYKIIEVIIFIIIITSIIIAIRIYDRSLLYLSLI